jgi:hypothetical protein
MDQSAARSLVPFGATEDSGRRMPACPRGPRPAAPRRPQAGSAPRPAPSAAVRAAPLPGQAVYSFHRVAAEPSAHLKGRLIDVFV